jgi:RND family efflux transporter MFP subunit
MLKFLRKLNTSINLLKALAKKLKALIAYLKQRKLLTAFIIIVIIILGFTAYNRLVPKPPEKVYELTTVKKQAITQTVIASGTIHSETEIKLKFQTSGQMVWIGVREGDYVQKWQALASLDQRKLRKNLENELRDYSKERNDFEEALRVTYQDTIITDTAKRILEKNQWDLEKAVLDVEIEDITLKLATIISPIDGIVTKIDVPVAGVNITPTTAYFTIADPQNLVFKAQIDETDISLLSASQSAELILDAYPDEPISVVVNSIDFSASTDSSGSTVFIARFKLINDLSQKFRLGMNGEAIITVAEKQDILTIPYQALIEDETTTVKVVKDKKIIEQEVTTGISNEDYIEITSGLQENDTIVVTKKTKKR